MLRRTLSLLALLAAVGCGAPTVRRFPLAEPLWHDDDTRLAAHPPAEYHSSDVWDFIDQTTLRPLGDALAVRAPREAANVNALDEVPDSSWFTNRLGVGLLTARDLRDGSCTGAPPDTSQRWLVTGAKPNGINPGFFVRTPDGRRYLVKPDGIPQPERGSATDAIAARIYHVLGYNTPCNRIVHVDRALLSIAPNATYRDALGRSQPMTDDQIALVFAAATRSPDGRARLSASEFITGDPLGPFAYSGVRADDPNDVVPHEDRRELRALRVVAAWLNHYDSREQNTFTSWIHAGTDGRAGFVRHWLLDFSDCFGQLWDWDPLTRRVGYHYTIDFLQTGQEFLTLGARRQPWEDAQVDGDGWIFGYFGARHFEPESWRGMYSNPAFQRMSEHDAAWIARMLARLGPAEIRTLVDAGEFSHPQWSDYLTRTLIARREQILRRWLTRLSPLADPTLEGNALCVTDLAARAAIRSPATHTATRYAGARLAAITPLLVERGRDGRVCIRLDAHVAPDAGPPDSSSDRFVVIDIAERAARPLRVHLYDLGPARGFRLVGLERPDSDERPRE